MPGLGERLDRAPLIVRLVPAALGGAIVASTLGFLEPKLVGGAFLGGLGALLVLASARRVGPTRVSGGGWRCFEVVVEDGEDSISGIRRFLIERSRTVNAVFRIVEHYEDGRRRVVLGVSGGEGEDLVLLSVASALLRGKVRLRPIEGCSSIEEPVLRPEPPPEDDFHVWLGYDLSRPVPREIYLSLRDIEGHIGVFGSTGSGKSTTLQVIASRVSGFDVVVLDWTGEHARVLADRGFQVVDPREEGGFDVIKCSGGNWEEALEMISRALELTEPQTYLMEQVLRSGAHGIRMLYEMLADIPEESKWYREVKRGLARRRGTLLRSSGAAFQGDQCFIPRGNIVIDLSGILETFSRRAIANLVISTLFLRARGGDPRKVLLVVDEAHNIVSGNGRDVMNAVLAESRKFGLHVAYATQSPSLMGDLALLNTNTKIVHAVKSQRDKKVIIDALGLGEEWISRLDKLGRGVALLQSPSHPEPILISVQP